MRFVFLFLIIIVLSSCKPQIQPIKYGSDGCEFCKMTIVDKRYGTELVTTKGKVFKFDAMECMIHYMHKEENANKEFKYVLVSSFNTPETLIETQQSYILRSKNLPSPMGAYLTAFASKEKAEKAQLDKGGDVYSWSDLYTNFEEIKKKKMVFNE